MESQQSTTDATPAAGTDAAPDWATTPTDVACPMCEYNLRGLTTPRCPECGYSFGWSELLDADRRLHPYLFEHHPERNIWSFWKTAVGGLRPWRFWTTLHPAQPSNLRRLLVYWFVAAVLMLGAVAGHFVGAVVGLQQQMQLERANATSSLTGIYHSKPDDPKLLSYLDMAFPVAPSNAFFSNLGRIHREIWVLVVLTSAALVWPWATFFTLGLFRWSMRRAKVRSIHVLRCALYGCDLGLWAGSLGAVPLGILAWLGTGDTYGKYGYYGGYQAEQRFTIAFLGVAGMMLLVAVWRLTTAYARYLRFHMPFATILASQLILLLLLTTIISYTDSLWHSWVVQWFL